MNSSCFIIFTNLEVSVQQPLVNRVNRSQICLKFHISFNYCSYGLLWASSAVRRIRVGFHHIQVTLIIECVAAMLVPNQDCHPHTGSSRHSLLIAFKVKLWSVKLLKVRKPTCGILPSLFSPPLRIYGVIMSSDTKPPNICSVLLFPPLRRKASHGAVHVHLEHPSH